MSVEVKKWTLEGFVDHFAFVHDTMGDHKYAWVLGAGASKSSGIPLGSELVDRWLAELYARECQDKTNIKEVKDWATSENLGKERFHKFKWDERASFYPQIFQRRFSEYPAEGYAYLENVMSGNDPSPGYSILAAALSGQIARPHHAPPHNVVITTNFDNLVGDALSIYTDTFPLICGHESLAGFAGVSLTRPLICKIHRDLLFAPQNDPRSLKRLKDAWGMALTKLFEHYTPLFVGYGGNDDTLMDLLESLDPGSIKGQIVWTYYEKANPSERIRNVVAEHDGVLVPVPDFDLLMILLGEKMKIGLLDEQIEQRSEKRVSQYRTRVANLDILEHPSVLNAFGEMASRSGGWWAWDQRANAEKDPKRTEQIYREAIKHIPDSAELHINFAYFLGYTRRSLDEAETYYKRAIELEPSDLDYVCHFAYFLTQVRHKHDDAEIHYKKAIELNPNHALVVGDYALFLTSVRGNYDQAEIYYQKALRLEQFNAKYIGAYANFLTLKRSRHDEAERQYKNALEHDPDDANHFGNYAAFLIGRGRIDEAAERIAVAKKLNKGVINQLAAELALYEGLSERVYDRDDSTSLRQLAGMFTAGYVRLWWSFDDVLRFAKANLLGADYNIYVALAEGILDEAKVPDVEKLLASRVDRPIGSPPPEVQAAPDGNGKPSRIKRLEKGKKKVQRRGTQRLI